MTLLPLSLLFAGCTPQDAEVTGDFAIFLAAASSENIDRLERTGTDVEAAPGKLGLTPIDCRDLQSLETVEAIEAARLAGVDYAAECCSEGDGEDCTPIQARWFGWLDDYAYFLNEGKIEPWRTEAVLTTEGDLQLTVHMDFPQWGDFRFGWVIDPDFQPTECEDGENGAELVDVDGGNWLENWSVNEEKGKLWHLNSGAYQINPSDNAVAWYFEQEWQAGATFARFADEEFYGHAIDYQDELYRPFYANSYAGDCNNGTDDDGDGYRDAGDPDCVVGDFEGTSIPQPRGANPDEIYNNWVSVTEDWFAESVTDLNTIGKSAFPLEMKIENNNWRSVDESASGLDSWLGVSPSWVRIDNPEAIEVGNDTPITGEFQIYLEGVAAASKVFVHGTFSIDNVREDVWGFQRGTLEEVKQEENNTPTCGEDRTTTVE
ncbi:MAG: hypothetical protein Q8P41_05160 [Pseudomonadota bacterium]|nr:hypothetical protein [Pseudomonadota bacterium]